MQQSDQLQFRRDIESTQSAYRLSSSGEMIRSDGDQYKNLQEPRWLSKSESREYQKWSGNKRVTVQKTVVVLLKETFGS